MITRAAYRLANLLAAAAVRIDRRHVRTVARPESFPVVGFIVAAACLLALATGWVGR